MCPILITDLFQSRLDFAKKLVPNVQTVLIARSDKEEDIAEKIIKAADGKVRVAMDCTGIESSIRAAIYSVKFGGKGFVIGVGKTEMNFPFIFRPMRSIYNSNTDMQINTQRLSVSLREDSST